MSSSARLEIELLERESVDGLEEQDEADKHQHCIPHKAMLVPILHLHSHSQCESSPHGNCAAREESTK